MLMVPCLAMVGELEERRVLVMVVWEGLVMVLAEGEAEAPIVLPSCVLVVVVPMGITQTVRYLLRLVEQEAQVRPRWELWAGLVLVGMCWLFVSDWRFEMKTIPNLVLLSFVALFVFGCTGQQLPPALVQACPVVGASPVEQARVVVGVAELVCADKPCAKQVGEISATVEKVDATRKDICNEWPKVELVARLVDEKKLTAAVALATKVLRCNE
jgi:hypothetical protein